MTLVLGKIQKLRHIPKCPVHLRNKEFLIFEKAIFLPFLPLQNDTFTKLD